MNRFELYEKRVIKRYALVVGAVLLLSFFVEEVFSTIMVLTFNFCGYSQQEINTLLTDPWIGYSINSLFIISACVLPFCLLKFICKTPISVIGSFNSPRKANFKSCIGFAFGFALIANIVTAIFNFILENFFNFKAITSDIGSNTTNDPFEFVFILVCSAVFPALVEEFAFRGMVLGSLRKFGDWPAILISSIVFAVFHGNFVQIPFAFLVGVVLGIIVVISGSIWTSVLAHFLINAYAIFANQFQNSSLKLFATLFYVIIALGIICFVHLLKNGAFKLLNNKKLYLSTSSKFSLMLFSPTIIIFIFVMIFVALQYRA